LFEYSAEQKTNEISSIKLGGFSFFQPLNI